AIVIDVTESPIERPKKNKNDSVFGKKKRHTLKSQVIINQRTGEILCTAHGQGKTHDFKLFLKSKIPLSPAIECLVDKGYQGIQKIHVLSQVPQKKPRKGELTDLDKKRNRELARKRVVGEHINRKLKIFKILADRYRNRRN
ncbi:MAG TPA: transposase family protein, partial [Phormidium sp.]